MSVIVLIISHDEIGTAFVNTATKVFGELPLPTTVVNINPNTDPEKLTPKLEKLLEKIGTDEGTLILTDLFGATPSNIAKNMQEKNLKIRVVSGLNMPMLMKVMNYAQLNLDELVLKAVLGGKEGVIGY